MEMIAQAHAESPNECCGLLAGTIVLDGEKRIGRIERRFPLVNEAASPVEYLSEPKSMFAAYRDYTKAGLDVLAIYHSHPTSPPLPSKTDRERNYSPDVVNFIISLKDTEPEVRSWWLTESDFREADWEIL